MKKKVLYGILVVGTLLVLAVLLVVFKKDVNEDALKFKKLQKGDRTCLPPLEIIRWDACTGSG